MGIIYLFLVILISFHNFLYQRMPLSAVGVSAYYYGKSFRDIFVLLMIAAASFGAIVFSLVQSDIYHTLHYDNGAYR